MLALAIPGTANPRVRVSYSLLYKFLKILEKDPYLLSSDSIPFLQTCHCILGNTVL